MITCLGCLVTPKNCFHSFRLLSLCTAPQIPRQQGIWIWGKGAGIGASFGGWFGSSSLLAVFLDCLVSGCFMVFQCWNLNKKTVNYCFGFSNVQFAYPSRFSLTFTHIAAMNTKLSVSLTISLGGPHTEIHHTAKTWHATSQTLSYPGTYNTQERVLKNKVSGRAFKISLWWLSPSQSSKRKSVRGFHPQSQWGWGQGLSLLPVISLFIERI